MKQEDKELLLKDLCARLPYGVKCYNIFSEEVHELAAIELDGENTLVRFWDKRKVFYHQQVYLREFKPYLFSISSMGPKEYVEFVDLGDETSNDCFVSFNFNQLDWLNAHHFDYRGLIEKGLAIDATGLNIY